MEIHLKRLKELTKERDSIRNFVNKLNFGTQIELECIRHCSFCSLFEQH